MSFASEVKKELLSLQMMPCCKDAMLAGILQGSSEIVLSNKGMNLKVETTLPSLIRFLAPLLKAKYKCETETYFLERTNINKSRIYVLEVKSNAERIIGDYHLMPFDTITLDDELLENDCCKHAFLRGAFISKGSINDPRKSNYHLEICFKKAELAVVAYNILESEGLTSKLSTRRGQSLLYIKRSEVISEMLAFMGANSGVLHFEDLRIMRDLKNSVNRVMNCDIANASKSLQYCNEQLEAIKYLKDHGFDKHLSLRLQDAIRLREEYPEATLSELSEYSENILGKHLSKSGISHCMQEITAYYNYVTSAKEKEDNNVIG